MIDVVQLRQRSAFISLGGSPGLVVMGGDSHSEGRGFEYRCHILVGHYFILVCCKIVLMFVWKGPKINEKENRDGPFLENKCVGIGSSLPNVLHARCLVAEKSVQVFELGCQQGGGLRRILKMLSSFCSTFKIILLLHEQSSNETLILMWIHKLPRYEMRTEDNNWGKYTQLFAY